MKVLKRMGLAGALASTLAFGCSTMGKSEQVWSMNATQKIPAANGQVQIGKTDKDGNHDVKVAVEHLAPPADVYNGTTQYVVWLKPDRGKPQNVGVLKLDDKFNGKLETSTPFTTFQVMVTAESAPDAVSPSDRSVLSTTVYVPT
jgi:hypothetical protein